MSSKVSFGQWGVKGRKERGRREGKREEEKENVHSFIPAIHLAWNNQRTLRMDGEKKRKKGGID